MIRASLLAAAGLSLLVLPAEARQKPKAEAAPPSLQASPIGTFGDWNVFAAGEGKSRICYAISQPQVRLPKSLKRDPAYLFVTVRKGERVNNEVAVMLGFAPKPGSGQATTTAAANGAVPSPAASASDPSLAIGAARYALVVKGANAWVQNPADEGKVVAEMGRGKKVVIKAVSQRGNPSTDEYALDGFGEAMKRTREECK
jgi:invasion protein IalB